MKKSSLNIAAGTLAVTLLGAGTLFLREDRSPAGEHPENTSRPSAAGQVVRGKFADEDNRIPLDAIPGELTKLTGPTNDQERIVATKALLLDWAERDLAGLVGWFEERAVVDELHDLSRETIAEMLAEANPVEVVEWMVSDIGESARREIMGAFFRHWANRDPAAAAGELMKREHSWESGQDWLSLVAQVSAQWAETDIEAAWSWTESFKEGSARFLARQQMTNLWCTFDLQGAAVAAETSSDPEMTRTVAYVWAEQDPDAAAAWANGLTDKPSRKTAIAAVSAAWAQSAPEDAAAFATSLPKMEEGSESLVVVASVWAADNPSGAARWIATVPDVETRIQAIQQLMTAWTGMDSEGSGRWIEGLQPDASRDAAIEAHCKILKGSSPEAAFRWSERILSDAIREESLRGVGLAWMAADSTRARPYIEQSKVASNLKREILASRPSTQ